MKIFFNLFPGTFLYACTAVDASLFIEHDLTTGFLRFGVCTPLTTERTTLHENECPNPVPVVNGKSLYVEDHAPVFYRELGLVSTRIFFRVLQGIPFTPRNNRSARFEEIPLLKPMFCPLDILVLLRFTELHEIGGETSQPHPE